MALPHFLRLVCLFLLLNSSLCRSNVHYERADTNAAGSTGDSHCVTLMCISATVINSTVEYVLQSSGSQQLGWMAMGFGTGMIQSPIVIMWPNSDGSITLSQRMATAHAEPQVDASPPRIANVSTSLSSTSGTQPKLAYTIAANSDTLQNVIWAFATTPPSSSSPTANLQQHLDSGTFQLDLTKPATSNSSSSTSASTPSTSTSSTGSPSSTGNHSSAASSRICLEYYQNLIAGIAILYLAAF